MRDIVACMITIDRPLFGKENYLVETLRNLSRSEFFDSNRLAAFGIFNSRLDLKYVHDVVYRVAPNRCINLHANLHAANENAGFALEYSGSIALDWSCKWVLFLEDDLDFCADFLGSVGRYLDRYEAHDYRIIAFACPYSQVKTCHEARLDFWQYPVHAFYGSQCFATPCICRSM